MSASEEKKALPPAEMTLGGVFPGEIASIKQKSRSENEKRLKVLLSLSCTLVALLIVAGGVFLGLYLQQDSVITRTLKFRDGNNLYLETVETDTDDNTDTFYTESDNGVAAVMFDHNKVLKAYKFSGRDICYIVPVDEEEDEGVKETATDLENKEEGSTQEARNGGSRKMSLDESRTDTPELSEAMGFFCGDLEPRWATLDLTDSEEATGDIVLIAPGKVAPISPGGGTSEGKDRVKRGWGGRRRRRRRRRFSVSASVSCCFSVSVTIRF
uniref:BRICHOS domain-containing protein n=1 Tax=Branchiostoma floridae TaxID=7739 RepID=C3YCX7_BRAFL|eukprot:XP_002605918.1 hypothetical protein BRAFLDRAFT_87408 [Branchiostoma floridae]